MKTKTVLALLTLLIVAAASVGRADVIAGPITNAANGHVYFLLPSTNWTAAESEAVGLGGHLVTINDVAENHWVFTNFANFGGVERALWIGLFQPPGSVEPASGWTWISREPVTYTDWTGGEPNNNTGQNRGPQNWAMIWPSSGGGIVSPYSAEHWNDYWNSNSIVDAVLANFHWGLCGVVEIVPPVPRLTISRELSAVRLSWDSQTNRMYQIQYRADLATNAWADLGLSVSGNGTTNIATDTVIDPHRFYRVVPFP